MTQGGPAQAVVVSTEAPSAGPAVPIAVVSNPLFVLGAPVIKVVEVADGRPRLGGAALPVIVATGAAASSPIAGPPMPVYVVSGNLSTGDCILTEGGDFILLENGDRILVE